MARPIIKCDMCGGDYSPHKGFTHTTCRDCRQASDEAVIARFMSYVHVLPNGCWEWTGEITKRGYGRFTYRGKREMAHRFSYEHFKGPIPDGLTGDHDCHKPAECFGGCSCPHRRCVNPDHIEPMSNLDNCRKGHGSKRGIEASAAQKRAITHCPQDHPYDEHNTLVRPNGHRRCRECERLSCAHRRQSKLKNAA